jgi:hypothetical protein
MNRAARDLERGSARRRRALLVIVDDPKLARDRRSVWVNCEYGYHSQSVDLAFREDPPFPMFDIKLIPDHDDKIARMKIEPGAFPRFQHYGLAVVRPPVIRLAPNPDVISLTSGLALKMQRGRLGRRTKR